MCKLGLEHAVVTPGTGLPPPRPIVSDGLRAVGGGFRMYAEGYVCTSEVIRAELA